MDRYEQVKSNLRDAPKTWLVTGVAGFIGSNILETLLKLNQRVIGLDNFSTGFQRNLDEVKDSVGSVHWDNFRFIHGDVRRLEDCHQACLGVDYVLHQAALGSVPRSMADPIATNATNITGYLNMLTAARDAKVSSFTYAASSSTYGDHQALPKVEEIIGKPLSPYAVTKYVNELYAEVFARNYGFRSIGLRYFNVFGPRQDPNGAYAAVIPKWTAALIKGEAVHINGDGESSRDFCFVDNVVQSNLLAACAEEDAKDNVFNIAAGERTTLNELFKIIREGLGAKSLQNIQPQYRDFRSGDVRHSLADINKAMHLLGYRPSHQLKQGIVEALGWYKNRMILGIGQ